MRLLLLFFCLEIDKNRETHTTHIVEPHNHFFTSDKKGFTKWQESIIFSSTTSQENGGYPRFTKDFQEKQFTQKSVWILNLEWMVSEVLFFLDFTALSEKCTYWPPHSVSIYGLSRGSPCLFCFSGLWYQIKWIVGLEQVISYPFGCNILSLHQGQIDTPERRACV